MNGFSQASGRRLPRALALAAVLLALSAGWAAMGASGQPILAAPIPDLELFAGTSINRSIDLSKHFEFQDNGAATFSVQDLAAQSTGGHLDLFVQSGYLYVRAPSTSWSGDGTYRVRGCDTGGCIDSNVFEVRVYPPLFGRSDINPPGYVIESATGSFLVAPGSLVHFMLVGTPITNGTGPDWYFNGTLIGSGNSVSFEAPKVQGNYAVQAQFVSDGKHMAVVRWFEVGPANAQPWAWGGGINTVIALLAAAAVAMVASNSRMRRPFVLAFVSGIYPRLQPVSLLDHFSRGTLFQAIKEAPGIHFSELTRKTSMSRGRAAHHLRVMERAGLIRCEFVGAYTRYFTDSDPPQDDDYGLSPTEREVLRAVVERPGIFQTELAGAVARSAGTVSRAVKRLAGYGYVTPRREERQRRVYPGPREIPQALLGIPPAHVGPAEPASGLQ